MERLIITIHPANSDQGLLSVEDAMQQVLDVVRLHNEAQQAISSPSEAFVWRLERASANSPFSVVALAEAADPTVDIEPFVRRAKHEVSAGLRRLARDGEPSPWMGPEAIRLARCVFERNRNGIGTTEVGFGDDDAFAIDPKLADSGLRAVSGIDAINIEARVGDRRAWGEIEGVMVAVGRYRNKPAIQMRTHQYAFVWCTLSEELVAEYGGQHKMEEVWQGRAIGVEGELIYSNGGKLRIVATGIRTIPNVPRIDLEAVLDPDFTAGLDPVEYLRQFHGGELAS